MMARTAEAFSDIQGPSMRANSDVRTQATTEFFGRRLDPAALKEPPMLPQPNSRCASVACTSSYVSFGSASVFPAACQGGCVLS